MRRKVSLKDIARQVGVSTALVSYVLNNKAEEKRVGKVIAEKIRVTAKELNYFPNQIAKSLKISKTHTIGLIVANFKYRYTSGITSSIEAEAKKNNYTVIFGSSYEDHHKFKELMNVLINRQVDGLILVPVEHCQEQIEYLKKHEIPFILIDRNFPEIETNYIAINNFKAAYQCVKHLISTGHRRIGFINYKTTMHHLQERTRGYLQAMKDHKLPVRAKWQKEIREKHLLDDIRRSVQELTRGPSRCSGLFFANDFLAINGLKNINTLQLRVPDDIAVVSFDESEAFELFYCPITHSRQPLEAMGKIAVNTLIEVMSHKQVSKQIYLESDFVKGKSCGEE